MSIGSVSSSGALGGYDPSTGPLSSVSAQAKNETLQEVLSGTSSSSASPSSGASGAAPSVTSAVNQSILDMLL